jgi:hypothetical protein
MAAEARRMAIPMVRILAEMIRTLAGAEAATAERVDTVATRGIQI